MTEDEPCDAATADDMGGATSKGGVDGRSCVGAMSVSQAELEAEVRTSYEHSWNNPFAAREASLGVDRGDLLSIARGVGPHGDAGEPLHVEVQLVDMARPRRGGPGVSALVAVGFERKGSGYDAPTYTSFGAYARGAGIKLSKGKPKESLRVSDRPPLTRLNYEGEAVDGLDSLWLLELRRPVTMESVVEAYCAIRGAAKGLLSREAVGGVIMLPAIGYNGEATVPLRAVAQELIATSYHFAQRMRTRSDLAKVQVIAQSRAVFEKLQSAFERERRVIRALEQPTVREDGALEVPLGKAVARVRDWVGTHGKEAEFEVVREHASLIVSTHEQHAGKPPSEVRNQVAYVCCDAGLRVAESFVSQFSSLAGYDAAARLADRVHFLRYTRADGPDGVNSTETAMPPEEPPESWATPRSRMDAHRAVKGFVTQGTYEQLETLRRLGFKANHSVYAATVNMADAAFALDAVLHLLNAMTSPLLADGATAGEGGAASTSSTASAAAGTAGGTTPSHRRTKSGRRPASSRREVAISRSMSRVEL